MRRSHFSNWVAIGFQFLTGPLAAALISGCSATTPTYGQSPSTPVSQSSSQEPVPLSEAQLNLSMSHLSALKVEQDFPVYSSSVPFLSDRFYEVIFARSQAFWEGWEISPDPSSRATFYYLVNARNPSERAPPLGDSLEPERACKLRLFEVFDAQGNVLNREHSALESGDQRPTMSGLVQDRQIHRGVEFTVVDESYLNEFDREEVRNCIQSSADETDGYVSFCLKHRDEQGQLAFLVLLCDVYSGGDGLHSSLTPWTVRDLSTVSGGTLRPAGVR